MDLSAEINTEVSSKGARSTVLKPLLLLLIIASAATLSGTLLYQNLMKRKLDAVVQTHTERLSNASQLFARQLGEIQDLLKLLRNDDLLIEATDGPTVDEQRVGEVFARFGRVINEILQLRLLDSSGMERVRVDVGTQGPQQLPQTELQAKGHRYYFTETLELPPEGIYVSPIDLNVEHGKIVTPYQPTVRVASQFQLSADPSPGILILNYNLQHLFGKVEALSSGTVQLEALTPLGYWLIHPDAEQIWGQDRGEPDRRLSLRDPALWTRIQAHPTASALEHNGKIVSYNRVSVFDSNAGNKNIILMASTPAEVVSAMRREAALPSVILALLLMTAGSLLLWREHRYRNTLLTLNERLFDERAALQTANNRLDTALTQQQELQDDLVESRKLASLGMMVAGLSHELNTPIGGALLTVSSLKHDLETLEQELKTGLTRQGLEQFITSGHKGLQLSTLSLQRASELIKSFKRMAFERSNEELVRFAPAQLVADLVHTLQPQLKSHKIELSTDIAPALEVTSYPGVLSQVVQNLIVNAIDHGIGKRTGGKIRVYATEPDEHSVTFVVEDNGKGVSAEVSETLFDPFVTTNRNLGHTGLGLHFVHQWVTQRLGGWIDYENIRGEAEHGARFSVTVPRELKPV